VCGCGGDSESSSQIDEGIIEYDITYPKTEETSSMVGLMPNEMIFKFKNHNSVGELSASMGLFSTSLMTNLEKKTVVQTIKIFGKKFAAIYDITLIDSIIDKHPKMNVIFSEDTKLIAGYKCKKATINFVNDSIPDYDVYYTNEIKINTPNWSNHFKEIDGVLMEYRISKYNIEMRLMAKTVSKTKIDDSNFVLSNDYKIISTSELDSMFMNFN
jgi:GLPGLI family protein